MFNIKTKIEKVKSLINEIEDLEWKVKDVKEKRVYPFAIVYEDKIVSTHAMARFVVNRCPMNLEDMEELHQLVKDWYDKKVTTEAKPHKEKLEKRQRELEGLLNSPTAGHER